VPQREGKSAQHLRRAAAPPLQTGSAEVFMHKVSLLLAVGLIAVPACKKKKEEGGSTAGKTAEGGKNLPALADEPPVGDITPAEKPPFEMYKFRRLAKRNAKGWPKFEAYNLGTKDIKFMAIYTYAYDASGNQVGRTEVPLSWNGKIEPGKKSDWDIDVGSMTEMPANAASWDLCVSAIKAGDDVDASDNERCPEKKPKS
jgi:hypothetical protein